MKLRIQIAVIIVVALTIIAILSLQTNPPKMTQNQPTNSVAEIANHTLDTEAKKQESVRLKQPKKEIVQKVHWALEPLPPGTNLQEQLEELARHKGLTLNELTQQAVLQWSNAILEMSLQVNRPIEFYGKALDEKGLPLNNANVRFGCVRFPEDFVGTNVLADAEGLFKVAGLTGAILTVLVSKEGYEEAPDTNQNKFHYYSPAGRGEFRPSSNNPVIFHLRKKEL